MPLNYDALAAAYARNRQIHPGVLQALVSHSVENSSGTVLEIGCGSGNYILAYHASSGRRCVGLDPSAEMLAVARGRAASVTFLQGRGEALPFPAASFDLLFSVDVIHHVYDRPAYIQEAFRVLRPGGWLCTVTDSERVIQRRRPLSSYFPETVAVELGRYPHVGYLRALMTRVGFQAIVEQEVEHAYDLTDITAYRDKAFSSLHLIGEDAFHRGLARLEKDLAQGAIPCLSLYTLLWGTKLRTR